MSCIWRYISSVWARQEEAEGVLGCEYVWVPGSLGLRPFAPPQVAMDLLFRIYSISVLKAGVRGGAEKLFGPEGDFVDTHFQVLRLWTRDCFVVQFDCVLEKVWAEASGWSWVGVLGCLGPELGFPPGGPPPSSQSLPASLGLARTWAFWVAKGARASRGCRRAGYFSQYRVPARHSTCIRFVLVC